MSFPEMTYNVLSGTLSLYITTTCMNYENKWYLFYRVFCSPLEKVAQAGHRGVLGRSWAGAADARNHVQHRHLGNRRHRIAELPSHVIDLMYINST